MPLPLNSLRARALIAFADELEAHGYLDQLPGLRGVTVSFKFKPTGELRTVILSPEIERGLNGA